MLDKFLEAKHWQLFLIYFGLPFLLSMIGMSFIFAKMISFVAIAETASETGTEPNMVDFPFQSVMNFYKMIFVFQLPAIFIGLFWKRAVGLKLQNYIPEHLRLNTGFFNIANIGIMVLALVTGVLMFYLYDMMGDMLLEMGTMTPEEIENGEFMGSEEMMKSITIFSPLLMLCSFLSLIFSFYCFYFCAKTYKTAIEQREVSFGDYIGEFFLIWFFFIGVWIMQPKINKLVDRENNFYLD